MVGVFKKLWHRWSSRRGFDSYDNEDEHPDILATGISDRGILRIRNGQTYDEAKAAREKRRARRGESEEGRAS